MQGKSKSTKQGGIRDRKLRELPEIVWLGKVYKRFHIQVHKTGSGRSDVQRSAGYEGVPGGREVRTDGMPH